MDLKKLRLNSIFSQQGRAPSNSSSGFNILDTFLNSILPMIQNQGPSVMDLRREGNIKREHERVANEGRTAFNMSRMRPALPEIAQNMMQPEKPMNTVMQGINPYQEATLALRSRELESREGLNKAKQGETVRKNIATEEDRARRTAVLEQKLANDDLTESEAAELQAAREFEKTRMGQRFTRERDETQQGNRLEVVDRQAEHATVRADKNAALQRELVNIRNDNSKAAVERKAEIEKELAADKPLVPSQEKTSVQLKYNKLINEKPEYRDFVSINPDTGLVEVLPVGETKAWARDTVGPTEAQRQEILKYLGMTTDEKKEVAKKDSLGIR